MALLVHGLFGDYILNLTVCHGYCGCLHRPLCRAGRLPEKGRVLFAVRDIAALELVLVDPGTVVGPNYKSEPVCLQVGGAGGGAV